MRIICAARTSIRNVKMCHSAKVISETFYSRNALFIAREYVLNILRENNYPKDFLKNCLNPSACRNQNNSEGDTSIKGYAVVPYIQGVTEPIKRILSNCN